MEPQFKTPVTARIRGSDRSLPPFGDRNQLKTNDKVYGMTPPGVFFLAIFQQTANLKQIYLYDSAICQQLQNVQCQKGEWTAKRIARENNTTERSVRRAGQFAKGVDAAEKVEPGITFPGVSSPQRRPWQPSPRPRRRSGPLWSSSSGRPKKPRSPKKSRS